MAGQFFELNAIVRNQGDGPSGHTTLSYYRSTDSTVTSADTEVGTDWVSGLNASESSAESTLTYAPSATGTYYYGVCVGGVSGESDTTDNCSDAVAVTVSQFDIDSLPWVADGISGDEGRAMDQIRSLARIDPSMSHRVAGSLWFSDGVSDGDFQAVADLLALARSHPQAAALLTTVPDQTGELMQDVANSLQQISRASDTARLDQLLSQSWFQDGLTQEEAALIVVLRSVYETGEVFQDLVTNGHVRSETISAPLAGEVDLFVVGRSESWLERALERMRVAVESMEDFMGTPWPKPDTIALLELQSDLGLQSAAGWNAGTHVVLKNTSTNLTYHELAHHLFGGGFPRWLAEGAADFLMVHTLRLTEPEIEDSDATYFYGIFGISALCAPHGSANVQGWIETGAGDSYCPYILGQHFLRGMYRGLGHEVVSSAMRELYEGGGTTEDEIYQAFLKNTPSSERDKFRDLYHCHHGRPIPGYTPTPKAAISPEIRDALVALYNATNGPGWKNSENWLSDAPLDRWHGVGTHCDGSIAALNLSKNQLTGAIPAELGSLSYLQGLDLGGNQLTGEMPAELGSLSNLRLLFLAGNQLTGEIPAELGSLSNLQELDLGGNQLTGEIPAELGSLSNLRELDLGGNQLTGEMPVELGSLSNLEWLYLSDNQLTGEMPVELGSLSNLEWLYLSDNQLTGEMPVELGSLSNLAVLNLGFNQLTGEIPVELGSLSNLEALKLNANQLTGEIPAELGSLSNLRYLWLNANQLTGEIPAELGSLSNLRYLWLNYNQLTGEIPAELGSLSNLQELLLAGNQLTGEIPAELGSLSNLMYLWLTDNQLTGCVPRALTAVEDNDLDELGLEVCEDS